MIRRPANCFPLPLPFSRQPARGPSGSSTVQAVYKARSLLLAEAWRAGQTMMPLQGPKGPGTGGAPKWASGAAAHGAQSLREPGSNPASASAQPWPWTSPSVEASVLPSLKWE